MMIQRTLFDPVSMPNLDDLAPEERWHMREIVANAVLSRSQFISQYSDPRRDIRKECGHPMVHTLDAFKYKTMYESFGIAARVVSILPVECWQHTPEVYEDEDTENVTEFEQAWDSVCKGLRNESYYEEEEGNPVWDILCRADILAGIGRFGVILLGIDDGKELSQPIAGFEKGVPKRDPLRKPKQSKAQKQVGGYVNPKSEENELKAKEKMKAAGVKPVKADKEEEEAPKEESKVIATGTDEPVKEYEGKFKLLYMRAYNESLVQILEYEKDRTSPRYGQPLRYLLTLNDPQTYSGMGANTDTTTLEVHWSRIIHIADNLNDSEVLGTSRLQDCYDRLMDLQKLFGGSAEMYWRGAFPGLSFETHPNMGIPENLDRTAIKNAAERYMNSLQRYISTAGMTVKSLPTQVVDPTPQIKIQMTALCVRIGVPERVFMGSERGELASGQDDQTWNGRLKHRQRVFITPRIIVPFVDRLIQIGVLPAPEKYCVKWPDLDTLQPAEQADVASKRAQALSAYVSGGLDVIMSPMDFLVRELKYTEEEAKSILDNVVQHMEEAQPDSTDPIVPGHKPAPPMQLDAEGNPIPPQAGPPGATGAPKPGMGGPPKPPGAGGGKPFGKKPPTTNRVLELLQNKSSARKGSSSGSNCGIGPGGFQKNNTCAKGGGGGASGGIDNNGSSRSLGSIFSRLSSGPTMRGLTKAAIIAGGAGAIGVVGYFGAKHGIDSYRSKLAKEILDGFDPDAFKDSPDDLNLDFQEWDAGQVFNRFRVGGRTYDILAYHTEDETATRTGKFQKWEYHFARLDKNTGLNFDYEPNVPGGMTVLRHVGTSMNTFIEKYKPREIRTTMYRHYRGMMGETAHELLTEKGGKVGRKISDLLIPKGPDQMELRGSLYEKAYRRIARQNGYQFEAIHHGGKDPHVEFVMTRPRRFKKSKTVDLVSLAANASKAKKSSKSGGANCGIGPGGFQKGNTCAKGGGGGGKRPAAARKADRENFLSISEKMVKDSGHEVVSSLATPKVSRAIAKQLVDSAFGLDKESKKTGGTRIIVSGTQGKHNRPFTMSFRSEESMQRWAANNRPKITNISHQRPVSATAKGRLQKTAATALKITAGIGAAFATALVARAIDRAASKTLDKVFPEYTTNNVVRDIRVKQLENILVRLFQDDLVEDEE